MARTPIRKTKLIATIGPASDSADILRELMQAGMNVARLNFSHGNHEEHAARVKLIREVSEELGANVAIMADTRGFEIRTGTLAEGEVFLQEGSSFALYTDEREGNESGVSISFPALGSHISAGQTIRIDDGLIELTVLKVIGNAIHCKVIAGGRLRERKGVNVPDVSLEHDGLTEQDQRDLKFAVEQDLDYVAASFVNRAGDVVAIRRYVQSQGGSMPIIAKIETRRAVENLAGIVVEADGTMVARGDLGVEIPVEEVPLMQKRIIRTTVMNGKPVITATQMLDSMERNPRPTRAEATDVANAIFDGTSAIMLSGETAAGKYPVLSVRTMAQLALQAEAALEEYGYLQKVSSTPTHRITEAVSQAAITMAHHLEAAAIVTLTASGFTSRSISKFRPRCPILAVTRQPEVVRKLAMNWGVTALPVDQEVEDDKLVQLGLQRAIELGYLENGDRVVVTAGISNQPGSTSLIRVETVRSA